jgi:hypothetical protein
MTTTWSIFLALKIAFMESFPSQFFYNIDSLKTCENQYFLNKLACVDPILHISLAVLNG